MKRVEYFDAGQWPIHIGFTASEKAFKRELKRLQCEDTNFLNSDHASATTHFLDGSEGSFCAIICLGSCDNYDMSQVAALLAHEATHVAQRLWRRIGEHEPGDEAEAYLVQFITQQCLNELDGFRDKFKK